MAGLRSGAFGKNLFRCSECNKNPKLLKVWGHDEQTRMPGGALIEIDRGVETTYWNCPVRFIPDSIVGVGGFLELYDYHKNFPNAPMPAYKETSARFLEACRYFDSKVNEYTIDNLKDGE